MTIQRMSGLPRTFYRAVKKNPPALTDFMSNKALGKPPRGAELQEPELHAGLSVESKLERAKNKARDFCLGNFVAVVEIPKGSSIEYAKTLGGGHHTLWGDPQEILDCVASIVPI